MLKNSFSQEKNQNQPVKENNTIAFPISTKVLLELPGFVVFDNNKSCV